MWLLNLRTTKLLIFMIESLNKLIANVIRVGVITLIGFSLYFIYNSYDSFALKKNVVEVQPKTTGRIVVTAAE
jgi:hypothetical protein